MLAFIFISLAFATVASKKSLQELNQERSKFLAQMAKLDAEHPSAAIVAHLKKYLILPQDAKEEDWLTFAAAAPLDAPAYFQSIGQEYFTEEAFIQASEALIDEALPAIDSPEESNPDNLEKNKAYATRLEGIITEYFQLAQKFMVHRIYANAHTHIVSGEKYKAPLYPQDINQNFYVSLFNRVMEYAGKYDKDVHHMQGDVKVYDGAATMAEKLNALWGEAHQTFALQTIKAYSELHTFLLNTQYYYLKEIDYLIAYVAAAHDSEILTIIGQIKECARILLTLAQKESAPVKVDSLFSKWTALHAEVMNAKAEETKIYPSQMYYPDVFGTILEAVSEVLGEEASTKLAHGFINRRIGGGFDVNALPRGDNKPSTAIFEKDEKSGWKGALSLSPYATEIFNALRNVFQDTMLPKSHQEFYGTVLEAVTGFGMSAKKAIPSADMAQQFDAYLDKEFVTNKYYIILKLHGLNMIKNKGFPINFNGVSTEVIKATIPLLADGDYKLYQSAIDKAYGEFFKGKKYHVEGIERFMEVNEAIKKESAKKQEVSSKLFGIVRWSERLVI